MIQSQSKQGQRYINSTNIAAVGGTLIALVGLYLILHKRNHRSKELILARKRLLMILERLKKQMIKNNNQLQDYCSINFNGPNQQDLQYQIVYIAEWSQQNELQTVFTELSRNQYVPCFSEQQKEIRLTQQQTQLAICGRQIKLGDIYYRQKKQDYPNSENNICLNNQCQIICISCFQNQLRDDQKKGFIKQLNVNPPEKVYLRTLQCAFGDNSIFIQNDNIQRQIDKQAIAGSAIFQVQFFQEGLMIILETIYTGNKETLMQQYYGIKYFSNLIFSNILIYVAQDLNGTQHIVNLLLEKPAYMHQSQIQRPIQNFINEIILLLTFFFQCCFNKQDKSQINQNNQSVLSLIKSFDTLIAKYLINNQIFRLEYTQTLINLITCWFQSPQVPDNKTSEVSEDDDIIIWQRTLLRHLNYLIMDEKVSSSLVQACTFNKQNCKQICFIQKLIDSIAFLYQYGFDIHILLTDPIHTSQEFCIQIAKSEHCAKIIVENYMEQLGQNENINTTIQNDFYSSLQWVADNLSLVQSCLISCRYFNNLSQIVKNSSKAGKDVRDQFLKTIGCAYLTELRLQNQLQTQNEFKQNIIINLNLTTSCACLASQACSTVSKALPDSKQILTYFNQYIPFIDEKEKKTILSNIFFRTKQFLFLDSLFLQGLQQICQSSQIPEEEDEEEEKAGHQPLDRLKLFTQCFQYFNDPATKMLDSAILAQQIALAAGAADSQLSLIALKWEQIISNSNLSSSKEIDGVSAKAGDTLTMFEYELIQLLNLMENEVSFCNVTHGSISSSCPNELNYYQAVLQKQRCLIQKLAVTYLQILGGKCTLIRMHDLISNQMIVPQIIFSEQKEQFEVQVTAENQKQPLKSSNIQVIDDSPDPAFYQFQEVNKFFIESLKEVAEINWQNENQALVILRQEFKSSFYFSVLNVKKMELSQLLYDKIYKQIQSESQPQNHIENNDSSLYFLEPKIRTSEEQIPFLKTVRHNLLLNVHMQQCILKILIDNEKIFKIIFRHLVRIISYIFDIIEDEAVKAKDISNLQLQSLLVNFIFQENLQKRLTQMKDEDQLFKGIADYLLQRQAYLKGKIKEQFKSEDVQKGK